MRNLSVKQLLVVLGMVVVPTMVSLLVQAQTVPVPSPVQVQPRVFQYKIVEATTDVASMQRILNEYGAAGWELVSMGLGDLTSPRMIFKR